MLEHVVDAKPRLLGKLEIELLVGQTLPAAAAGHPTVLYHMYCTIQRL